MSTRRTTTWVTHHAEDGERDAEVPHRFAHRGVVEAGRFSGAHGHGRGVVAAGNEERLLADVAPVELEFLREDEHERKRARKLRKVVRDLRILVSACFVATFGFPNGD